MSNTTPREKLMVEQKKGSLSDSIIYLILGILAFFIIFPILLYAVLTGVSSDWVYFGFVDAFAVFMILSFIGGIAGIYFGIQGIKTYRRMKKEEEKIY